MNETETEQLYQIIFRGDRSEGWQSWKRNLAAAESRNEGIPCQVGEAQKDPAKDHFNFKKGEKFNKGYKMIRVPIHPGAMNGYVYEHTLVAENALGSFLPDGAVVHHVNEDKLDNTPSNLVICENNGFHLTLHRRARALKVCGHADGRLCTYCKMWDDPQNMRYDLRGGKNDFWFHGECRSNYGKSNYAKRKINEPSYWKKSPPTDTLPIKF